MQNLTCLSIELATPRAHMSIGAEHINVNSSTTAAQR